MDNSSPITTSGDQGSILMANSSRPPSSMMMMHEPRRLRPQHEQPLKCPRCESTNTKFCYYNNYSLTQPRYFCKTCRRYWTRGGTLRNIPVGGGCRKNNKKQSSSSSNSKNNAKLDVSSPTSSSLINNHQNDSVLSPPALSSHHHQHHHNWVENQSLPIGLMMENKYEALLGGNCYNDFMGSSNNFGGSFMGLQLNNNSNASNGMLSPFGMQSLEYHHTGSSNVLESSERQLMMMPFDNHHASNFYNQLDDHGLVQDVKPNAKIQLAMDQWQDEQQQHQHQQQQQQQAAFGYNVGGLGSWTGLMNGYGSSSAATNPLV